MTDDAKILAVHPGALGDVILFGRLLERLGGPVTLAAHGEKARLLAGLGVAARALDFSLLPMHELFSDQPLDQGALATLLGGHDRLVSCFAGGNLAAEMRLAAACGAGSSAFLPIRPPPEAQAHLTAIWFDMLGLTTREPGEFAAWPVPPAWRQAAGAALAGAQVPAGQAVVVLAPGAGARRKCWPLENFLDLAGRLAAAGGFQPVLLLGPVELEQWPAGEVQEVAGRSLAMLASPPLETLAGVLAGASAFVGNDSGVGHLAAAVGCRTLSLFGPTCPTHFAPLGPHVLPPLWREPIELINVSEVLDQLKLALP